MIDLHLFALNCNESFRIVVDEKEKRAKLCCLTEDAKVRLFLYLQIFSVLFYIKSASFYARY